MRDTGGSDTSLGNSTVMAKSWYSVLLGWSRKQHHTAPNLSPSLVDIVAGFRYLGLDMKIKTPTMDQVTFLKGMWYQTHQGIRAWGPLPSRVLKMGKLIEDPVSLYKVTHLPKEHRRRAAAEMFLKDLSSSYKPFLPVPFVSNFVHNFGSADWDIQRRWIDTYKIQADGSQQNYSLNAEGLQQILDRYDITLEQMNDALDHFPIEPFSFTESPVYFALARVDYF